MNEIVTTNWLFNNLYNNNLVIFDCSWFLPSENRNTKKNYKTSHIPGSFFFDINKISNKNNKLPNMVPNLRYFKNCMKNFNIHENTKIITYGCENLMGPSRAWWMFKYFGFKNVNVLNGGLNKWIRERKPITENKSLTYVSSFDFKIDESWISNKDIILKKIKDKNHLIFDARNKKRFTGMEKEPRKKLRSGHIPNSKNIFWKDLTINGEKFKNKNLVLKIFYQYNTKNRNITLSCGSGISACVLSLSLMHVLGIKGSVYDGSWTEWSSNKKLPISK